MIVITFSRSRRAKRAVDHAVLAQTFADLGLIALAIG